MKNMYFNKKNHCTEFIYNDFNILSNNFPSLKGPSFFFFFFNCSQVGEENVAIKTCAK